MRYYIDFQHLPEGAARPIGQGHVVPIEVDEGQAALIPNVGGFVHIDNSINDRASFSGRVRTRLFAYTGNGICGVNIVVEETDDDRGKLIKE